MEEQQAITKQKSFLEKTAPFVLVALLIFLAYFGLTKIKFNPKSAGGENAGVPAVNVQVPVDVDFLNSDAFKKLKFIPDSAVFNEVEGYVPSGREDPFAPVY